MSKKMKLPSLFKNKEINNQQWQWPSCNHPKTLSFRANDDVFKTVNSIFLDVETPESWFTNSSECASTFSDHSDEHNNNNSSSTTESLETIIRGVMSSERLFFEPGETSSILKETKKTRDSLLPFKESVAVAMESDDPYLDFKKSMQEMVESNGLDDWDCLEELLGWYLKMNGKQNHGFIVGAFVDILVELSDVANSKDDGSSMAVCCSETTTSYSSAGSCFSSSPVSPAGVVLGNDDQVGSVKEEV